jgi:hypothetical protein
MIQQLGKEKKRKGKKEKKIGPKPFNTHISPL